MLKRITLLLAPWNNFLLDIFITICLLLAGWKYTNGLEQVMDLSLYDETKYMVNGATLMQKGLPPAEWGPLYAIWYFIQSRWHADYIGLHYGNAILLAVATPLVIYWTLRRHQLAAGAAGLFAYLFLLCHANLAVWPKSNNFALLIVFLSFLLATLPKTVDGQLAVLTTGALISAYVRPELFLTFLLLVMIYGVRLLINRQQTQQRLTTLTMVALLAGVLFVTIGIPIGSRSLFAFGQFYAVNWVRWTGSQLSPWTDWQTILHQSFGEVHSVGEALRNNPAAFLRHITDNTVQIPAKFVGLLFVHAPLLRSNQWKQREAYLLLAGFLLLLLSNAKQWSTQLRRNLFPFRILSLAVGCYLVPALFSAIVVAPRSNYLLIAATLFGSLLLLLFFAKPLSQRAAFQSRYQPMSIQAYALPVLSLVLIGLTPPTPGWYRETLTTPNRAVVNTLRALALKTDIYLLEVDGGYGYYIGDNAHWVSSASKTTNFNAFLQTEHINMIVLSEPLLQDSRLIQDPEWQTFLKDFHSRGYTQIPVPETDRAILVANAVLANTP